MVGTVETGETRIAETASCVFCKIVSGEYSCAKLWEDESFLAFLDINPNTTGMALVVTKRHFDSRAFGLPPGVFSKFFEAARTVSSLLEKGLPVSRVALVMEGMGVNHAHLKLYPLHGLGEELKEVWASERKFFEKYEGYLSTQLGPQKSFPELQKLAEEILANSSKA